MLKSLSAIAAYRQGNVANAAEHLWLQYIVSAEERIVNVERIHSLQELTQANPVLDYVERSLQLLDSSALSYWMKEILEEVLCWSETAKGGTFRDRIRWQEEGINCFVHNIGSAQLYLRHFSDCNSPKIAVIHRLIEAHGLIGQQIRGEVPASETLLLAEMVNERWVTAEELEKLLVSLNYCVIGAVLPELWQAVEPEVKERSRQIAHYQNITGESCEKRLGRLRSVSIRRGEDFETEYRKLETAYPLQALFAPMHHITFWYAEPALQDFTLEQFLKILSLSLQKQQLAGVKHISFEMLMNSMYYDYKGVKKINVYKQRIIEKYLSELGWDAIRSRSIPVNNPHLVHRLDRKTHIPDTIFFQFEFSAAAEKLIEFCVEAEKSALYERAVLMLFDLFELRRDAYDRFHNEEGYLADMNQTADYKKIILDYIVGQKVIDIGPGGGVLLDLMEERMPDITPIGIDISTNVVEALNRKKQLEGRSWEVIQGDALNLKEYVEPGSIDTVIFSSILHELYSYISFNGNKFNPDTIAAALRSAFDVLAVGGRIIIRDGIMTEPSLQKRKIRFLKNDGMLWLERYRKDFAGRTIEFEMLSDHEVLMPVNDAMEFLYTYTWGEEAYVHEVQEQFGYFTLSIYRDFISSTLGERAKIVVSREYLQAGYTEALADKIQIADETGQEVSLPNSTCFIVIEKK